MAKSSFDNLMIPIIVVGGIAVVVYFMKDNIGVKEALGTLGGFFKNATDAIHSTGAAIGSGSYQLQQAPGGLFNRLNDWFDADRAQDIATSKAGFKGATDSILGTGNAIQQFFGGGTKDPSLQEILKERAEALREIQETYDLPDGQKKTNPPAPPRITNNCKPVRTAGTVKMVCD